MKHFQFLLLISFFSAGAWAQVAPSQVDPSQVAPSQVATLDQRRAELRMALKAPDERERPDQPQPPEIIHTQRHLSDLDRANLRQQLRQQHLDSKLD